MTGTKSKAIIFGVAAMTAASVMFAGGTAEARKGGGDVIEKSFTVPGPYKGYSGFVPGIGARSYYCDYQRIPNRQCTVVNGRERCKIVNWTLKQFCY